MKAIRLSQTKTTTALLLAVILSAGLTACHDNDFEHHENANNNKDKDSDNYRATLCSVIFH